MPKRSEKISDLAVFSLLSIIKNYGPVSQVRLSELSGYSRSTVSINCEKLLGLQIITTDSQDTSNRRKNIELRINKKMGYIVGIGMGGTVCRIALFDIECTLLIAQTFSINLACGPEPILKQICSVVDTLLLNYSDLPLLGIGMGIPSPVKYEEGVAYHPAFMPGWHLFQVKKYLSEQYNCTAYIDNEVNVLALGEYNELRGCGKKNLLCIKAGTGIGAGIIVEGQIQRGENGGGGNIGHIQIEGNVTPCVCGKCGCIEALASAPAIISQATKMLPQFPDSPLATVYKKNNLLKLEDIKNAADTGDQLALDIIKQAGTCLGNLLGKLIIVLDPGMVLIAGRSTILGPNYLDHIRKSALVQASPWLGADYIIDFSRLKEDSAATGAALLCIEKLFDKRALSDMLEMRKNEFT